MNKLRLIVLVFLVFACDNFQKGDKHIVASHPFLVGVWEGQGWLLDTDVSEKMGEISFSVNIESDEKIEISIGNTFVIDPKIKKAGFGFEIFGILNSEINDEVHLNKTHLIILLVIPSDNSDKMSNSLADFHLKTNYMFDFSMRVGGVHLKKQSN